MKHLFSLALLLLMSFGLQAQQDKSSSAKDGEAELKAAVKLTEDQNKKWDDITKKYRDEMSKVVKDNTMEKGKRNESLKKLSDEMEAAKIALLNDKQKEAYNAFKENEKNARREAAKKRMEERRKEKEKEMKDQKQPDSQKKN